MLKEEHGPTLFVEINVNNCLNVNICLLYFGENSSKNLDFSKENRRAGFYEYPQNPKNKSQEKEAILQFATLYDIRVRTSA